MEKRRIVMELFSNLIHVNETEKVMKIYVWHRLSC